MNKVKWFYWDGDLYELSRDGVYWYSLGAPHGEPADPNKIEFWDIYDEYSTRVVSKLVAKRLINKWRKALLQLPIFCQNCTWRVQYGDSCLRPEHCESSGFSSYWPWDRDKDTDKKRIKECQEHLKEYKLECIENISKDLEDALNDYVKIYKDLSNLPEIFKAKATKKELSVILTITIDEEK